MKKLMIFIILFLSTGFILSAQSKYDSTLADSLDADDYGMRYYTMIILKSGDAKIENQQKVKELFRSHMNNIQQMAKDRKLVVAGPFDKNEQQFRGIFILNTIDSTEVVNLMAQDGAIKAGLLDYDMLKWYGSAALPTYLQNHERIEKIKP